MGVAGVAVKVSREKMGKMERHLDGVLVRGPTRIGRLMGVQVLVLVPVQGGRKKGRRREGVGLGGWLLMAQGREGVGVGVAGGGQVLGPQGGASRAAGKAQEVAAVAEDRSGRWLLP